MRGAVEKEDNTYWVTFPEYGNTELVRLGSIMLQAKNDKSPPRGAGEDDGANEDGGGASSNRKRSRCVGRRSRWWCLRPRW